MANYESMLLQKAKDGPNRFDLVPNNDPMARKWELQAVSTNELRDWLAALRAARAYGAAHELEANIGVADLKH